MLNCCKRSALLPVSSWNAAAVNCTAHSEIRYIHHCIPHGGPTFFQASGGNDLSTSNNHVYNKSALVFTSCVATPNFQPRRCFSGGNLKAVSDRIKSIKSIQKITKAMKMIAASKLKGDQRRLEAGFPFSQPTQKLMKRLPIDSNDKGDLTIIALTSDKGLCGGINSSVARQTRALILEAEGAGTKVTIYGVGDKIRNALIRLFGNRLGRIVNEVTKFPWSFTTASLLAERIIQDKPARLIIVYNHFKSLISFETLSMNILTEEQAEKLEKRELDSFEFEPERRDIWKDLHEFYFACTIYGCMLDNIASEQSARLSAMDTASGNAGEMLSSLSLKYNRARQAKITSELIEIISGANALA
ncbi:ATP synthase F1 gamma subunit [Cardiosporidium cionae]|uniref:F-ATPase gamma subunit n=1 Tax=Cardiosporidium cionae TaxID=476202 RepID=A0ABQ7JFN9_9APIC|nr:ATP synthase F1 gamma subunit [Cardiosporidium cionae]|eukprot:KAF8822832.1 ATP synthase F1 gamma subunit [Cardiosporidium cionae]